MDISAGATLLSLKRPLLALSVAEGSPPDAFANAERFRRLATFTHAKPKIVILKERRLRSDDLNQAAIFRRIRSLTHS